MKSTPNKYFIDLGEVRLPIKIKKLRTSRRMIIRYQPLQKSVSLTLPQSATIKQGIDFINRKQEWIIRQVKQYSHNNSFSDGNIIPILGKNIRLEHIGGRGLISETENIWQVHGDIEFMERRVKNLIIKKTKSEIIILAENFAKQLNVKIGNITLRDTSSRWGSCSHDGNLSFSWRLAFAPYEVMVYIVAHEVAHIREHNHSNRFWELVEKLNPEFMKAENWLKKNGKLLYQYGTI